MLVTVYHKRDIHLFFPIFPNFVYRNKTDIKCLQIVRSSKMDLLIQLPIELLHHILSYLERPVYRYTLWKVCGYLRSQISCVRKPTLEDISKAVDSDERDTIIRYLTPSQDSILSAIVHDSSKLKVTEIQTEQLQFYLEVAIDNGNLDSFRYLLSFADRRLVDICVARCVTEGRLQHLEYCYSQHTDLSPVITFPMCRYSYRRDDEILECLRFATTQNVTWSKTLDCELAVTGMYRCFQYCRQVLRIQSPDVVYHALQGGNLHIINEVYEAKDNLMYYACMSGKQEVVQYLQSKGYRITPECMDIACRIGLEFLQYVQLYTSDKIRTVSSQYRPKDIDNPYDYNDGFRYRRDIFPQRSIQQSCIRYVCKVLHTKIN